MYMCWVVDIIVNDHIDWEKRAEIVIKIVSEGTMIHPTHINMSQHTDVITGELNGSITSKWWRPAFSFSMTVISLLASHWEYLAQVPLATRCRWPPWYIFKKQYCDRAAAVWVSGSVTLLRSTTDGPCSSEGNPLVSPQKTTLNSLPPFYIQELCLFE